LSPKNGTSGTVSIVTSSEMVLIIDVQFCHGKRGHLIRILLGGAKTPVDLNGLFWHPNPQMTKDQLISLIKKILGTDADLQFLAKLDLAELKLLVACIRERLEGEKR
jgi:hypothetical protein